MTMIMMIVATASNTEVCVVVRVHIFYIDHSIYSSLSFLSNYSLFIYWSFFRSIDVFSISFIYLFINLSVPLSINRCMTLSVDQFFYDSIYRLCTGIYIDPPLCTCP
jgi:hypothetical protein